MLLAPLVKAWWQGVIVQSHNSICTDNHDKSHKFCLQKQLEFNNELFFLWLTQSANPPFNGIELDHSDSGREGCAVSTLTITAEPKHWEGAVKVGVQEVKFLMLNPPSFFFFSILFIAELHDIHGNN